MQPEDAWEGEEFGSLPVLPEESPVDATLRAKLQPFHDTIHIVRQRIEGWGLPVLLSQPKVPFPPADLPKGMTADELVVAYDTHLGWQNYLATVCADTKNQLVASRNVLAQIEATIRRILKDANRKKASRNSTGYMTEQDIADAIETNPVYAEAKVALQTYEQLLETTQALLSVITRNLQAISRLVTIRGQEMQRLLFGGGGSVVPGGRRLGGGSPPSTEGEDLNE